MGRGVSSGGGQSSLGYLFGGPEEPKAAPAKAAEAPKPQAQAPVEKQVPTKAAGAPSSGSATKDVPAGIQGGNTANNYFRADGQNTGNFITDRPSTKVHAAPGGGSSLGYLLGGNSE